MPWVDLIFKKAWIFEVQAFFVFFFKQLIMKNSLIFLAGVVVASFAVAQTSQANSNAGVKIQGNTLIEAEQKNVTAVAIGEGNTAKNVAGAIKGNTQIQGNTTIKAKQSNATAVAIGKNNTAINEVGVIGGK